MKLMRTVAWLAGLVVVCVAGMVWGQAAKSGSGKASAAAVQVPKDPKELMVLAAKVNGLAGVEDRAWHVKADYQIFDPDGRPEQKGVYEEWWAGPQKYKVRYSGEKFEQTLYVNGAAWSVSGSEGWPPQQAEMATRALLWPLPPGDAVAKARYFTRKRKLGKARMLCVYQKWEEHGPVVPNTCFQEGMAAVRVEEPSRGVMTVFNDVQDIGGHYVAKSVMVEDGFVPVVKLRVTKLEFPASFPESVFKAPASGVAAPVVPVEPVMLMHERVGGDDVVYPVEAKRAGVTGVVILGVVIDATGKVTNVKVIAGPSMLREDAARAVKTWRYHPYLVDGKPVKVETEVFITFAIDG